MKIMILGRRHKRAAFFCLLLLLLAAAYLAAAPSIEHFAFERAAGDIYYPIIEPDEFAPVFNPAESGYSIWINLDKCIATVYKDGSVHKTYPISGGKASTPSPLGTFQIVGKANWGEGFGGSWIALNVPWGKYGFHGTLEPWDVGVRNGSKGCIRMKNSDVAHLKKYIPIGTNVTITHSEPVFRALKSGKFGSDVLKVQKALRALKFYSGPVNGRFGGQTEQAVRQFQKAYKLKVDGVVGWGTYNRIFGEE